MTWMPKLSRLPLLSVATVLVGLPGACMTLTDLARTKNSPPSDTSSPARIGHYVTHNDICRKFENVNVEKYKTKALRHAYRYDSGFLQGYEEDRWQLERDNVGLSGYCPETVDILEKAYLAISSS